MRRPADGFFLRAVFVFCLVAVVSLLDACTIGAFSPAAMVEERAVLWKNRDVTNPDQEVKLFAGPRFRFVANVYAGETLDVWAGINEAGFAIMNSNSYNLSGIDSPDDGNVMRLALGTCSLVSDFARLMDSLNFIGRETPANYGVFDAAGNVAIFEASYTSYTEHKANLDSLGFLIRANYSMSGGQNRMVGKNRYERAMALCVPVRQENRLSVDFIFKTLSRDLGQVGFNPYPLPFFGTLAPLSYGYLPTDTTICRATTRSVEVMVGPRPGTGPGTGMMWIMLGCPVAALPVPVWVVTAGLPEAVDGTARAELCDEAQRLFCWFYPDPDWPRAINTFRLSRWLEHIAPVESTIFALVAEKEREWGAAGPDPVAARSLTEAVCQLVINTYQRFWELVESDPTLVAPAGRENYVATIQRGDLNISGRAAIYDVAGRRLIEEEPTPGRIFFLFNNGQKGRLILVR